MAHVHDKQRIKMRNNMAHVYDKQRIKMGNKRWPMYTINKE
jgi:hypothetical protein